MNQSDVAGKVAVLGASSGLGAALALIHHHRGDELIVVARRSDRLVTMCEAAKRRSQHSGGWSSVKADLTSVEDLKKVAAVLVANAPLGRIYLNAAQAQPKSTGSLEERLALTERFIGLLFKGYVALVETLIDCRALLPGSTVVAISSLAAALPFEGMELYCAGKAALEAWCKTIRLRGGPRVAIVRPGRFESEFFETRPLDLDRLPYAKARRIIRAVDRRKDWIEVGGLRDMMANRLSSLLGPCARKIVW
jgi:uncharacterized protein